MEDVSLLSAEISVDYPTKRGVLRGARLEVAAGEILGLVGQSGSGKSTLALALLGLLDGATVTGTARLNGRDLLGASGEELRRMRGSAVSLIPQSPLSALNPALRIAAQMREAWIAHATASWQSALPGVRRLLESVGLPGDDAFLRRYPSQISVGQAQRVLVAMALLHNPALLIADEPTSALDMITQRDVLDLLRNVQRERGMGILFISHDLISIAGLCGRIAILWEGEIVECEAPERILRSPRHPYTQKLVNAAPRWP